MDSKKMIFFSMIIPARNEEGCIEKTMLEIISAFYRASIEDYEIIVVNDNSSDNTENILNEIIDDYKKEKSENLDIRDNVAKSFACKTAIKAGDRLTLEEMNSLIDQLFAAQSPYFCPHGRPVIINLTKEELDKRFGRI